MGPFWATRAAAARPPLSQGGRELLQTPSAPGALERHTAAACRAGASGRQGCPTPTLLFPRSGLCYPQRTQAARDGTPRWHRVPGVVGDYLCGADSDVPQGPTSKPLCLTPCIPVSRRSCLNITRWGEARPCHLRPWPLSSGLIGLPVRAGGGQAVPAAGRLQRLACVPGLQGAHPGACGHPCHFSGFFWGAGLLPSTHR